MHKLNSKISCNALGLNAIDPHTKQCESDVQRIIHMKNITNAFNDSRNIMKSYIHAVNAPIRIEIPGNKSIS